MSIEMSVSDTQFPDLARLVLIRSSPRRADYQTDLGTGYFVTDDLILTASHVVDELAEIIEVRPEVRRAGCPPWTRAVEVAWRNDTLDAALLRAPGLLRGGVPGVQWAASRPPTNVAWYSTAYPEAMSVETDDLVEYKTAGLSGVLYSQGGYGQGLPELDLAVDAAAAPGGWHGISGAPVFVGDKLSGLIKTYPEGFTGRRLAGVPSDLLLGDAGFRTAIAEPWLRLPTDGLWVLVLQAESRRDELVPDVSAAIDRHATKFLMVDERGIPPEPVVASVMDALQSPARWLQLVQALCSAPIVVADVTEFQPAIMLFLGTRAVVRRGITIATTANPLDETELSLLPFNIQETKLISHHGEQEAQHPRHPLNLLASAVYDGLTELKSYPGYLDLPAYDAVRQPLPEHAPGESTVQEHVLVLCSFHTEYEKHWKRVSNALAVHYPRRTVVRMTDLSSPRLVGQALYEHIRWTTTCVTDWTDWRPNVFFEIGVRLACSDIPPIGLIDREQAERASDDPLKQKARLIELLRPWEYRPDDPLQHLRAEFGRHDELTRGRARSQTLDEVPFDGTYRAAVAAFDWKQERITIRPHDLLRWSAETQLGKDPQKRGVSPVLYSTNAEYSLELRHSVEERWIAAWYYLRNRYTAKELEARPELRSELRELGETVLQWVGPDSTDPHHVRLRREVSALIEKLEGSVISALDKIRALKTQAKNRRDAEQFERAVTFLGEAIGLAESELRTASVREYVYQLRSELADCYGLLGGIERRRARGSSDQREKQAHLEASVDAYDRGFQHEASTGTSSYNALNRLIGRLLLDPDSSPRAGSGSASTSSRTVDVAKELRALAAALDEQLGATRRGDYWALADLALLKVLLGDENPVAAYSRFIAVAPPPFAYRSVLNSIQALADEPVEASGRLREAIRYLEQRAARG